MDRERDLLMWQSGYDYAMGLLAEAYDDAVHARSLCPPPRTHEERIQQRTDEMVARMVHACDRACGIGATTHHRRCIHRHEDWPDVPTARCGP